MSGASLTSGMQTAAANAVLPMFFAIELDLPAGLSVGAKTLRLLDGSGVMTWSSMSFLASDTDYGSWQGITDSLDEALATSSPKFKTSFTGLSGTAIQQLCQPQSQGAAVTLYYGYYSLSTGAPVATPVPWFIGAIDVCHLIVSDSAVSVDVDVVSFAEYMLMNNEGARLNSAWHQLFFPKENGFAFVDNVTHQIPWGSSGPRPDQITDVWRFDNSPSLPSYKLSF